VRDSSISSKRKISTIAPYISGQKRRKRYEPISATEVEPKTMLSIWSEKNAQ
jgi:hypothetical protein